MNEQASLRGLRNQRIFEILRVFLKVCFKSLSLSSSEVYP